MNTLVIVLFFGGVMYLIGRIVFSMFAEDHARGVRFHNDGERIEVISHENLDRRPTRENYERLF